MKILIVGLVKSPQVQRVVEEGKKNGHEVTGCYVADLVLKASSEEFKVYVREKQITDDYDLIYLWTVGKRRWEWYVAAYYLNKNYGTVIVNKKVVDPNYNYYLTPASEYLKQFEDKIAFPKSAVCFSTKRLDQVLFGFEYPLIVKKANGRKGKGVFKVDSKQELISVGETVLEEDTAFVVREFIPNDGDIRVFTVGFKAIGAMKRTPKEGDFRSNISQGGSGAAFNLDSRPDIRDIAEKLSKITQTEIAGVDVIIDKETAKPYVLEINPGPQFQGLEQYTGVNAAGEIIKYFESLQASNSYSHSL